MLWSSVLSVLLLLQPSWCILRNVTVDDEYGDPVTNRTPIYRPPSNGSIWRLGPSCPGCHMTKAIDVSRTLYNTWHDCTWSPGTEPYSVEIDFEGVAVYAYFILANLVDSTTTLTNLSFTLDNEFVGTFEHIPTNSTDIQYNSPVYVNETLENKTHTLVISARGPSEAQNSNSFNSLLLFDYMIYTLDDTIESSSSPPPSLPAETSSSSTSRGSKTAIIDGLVAGSIISLTLAIVSS